MASPQRKLDNRARKTADGGHERTDKRDELSGHLARLALDVRTVRAERIVHLVDVFGKTLFRLHLLDDEIQDIAHILD